ncbi:MAG: hemerythrin family protein [Candidatus Moranbacteria bacterium]|nr:hemerythrin family protein [Candidatus Moranbacteria bacterium]
MTFTFIWDEKYSVGVAEIDEQHKKLVATIAKLNEAISKAKSIEKDVKSVLTELKQYVEVHFSTEEKYFKEFNYEFAEQHILEHREFAKKIESFYEKYAGNEVEISFELIDFLEDWLLDHMMTQDRKYMHCFAENGLK